MRHRVTLILALVAAAAAAHPTHAQTLSGTWTITSEGRRGPLTQTLVLTQDGSTLGGTVSFTGGGPRGGGGGGGGGGLQPIAISDGTVEGSSFRFTLTIELQGNSFSQQYSGTFTADSIEGTIEGGRGGARPFRGTRGG